MPVVSQYVISELILPDTAGLSRVYGLDIDGDPLTSKDNALGALLTQIASQGGNQDVVANLQNQVLNGSIVMLATLETTSTTDATAADLRLFVGDPTAVTPAACTNVLDLSTCGKHLQGTGAFAPQAGTPTNGRVTGSIATGSFRGGPGNVPLRLSLVAPGPIPVNLIGARIEIGQISADGLMAGTLAGAITKQELTSTVVQTMADALQTDVDRECTGVATGICPGTNCKPCGCANGSRGRTALDLFDDDDSCSVNAAELHASILISSFLEPDLDLFDADGSFSPRQDGVNDSFSIGIGFRAVKATFTSPPGVGSAL